MAETHPTAPNNIARTFKMRPAYLAALIALAFGFAFYNGIADLFRRWGEQQELSHGYFLPVIAGWMIWARRDALSASLSRPAVIGLAGVGLSAIILILSELTVTSLMVFQHLAMILFAGSAALALGGRQIFLLTLVPVIFLLFMVPPPYWVITVLSQQFQFWSSQLGVFMIELFGVPVFLSGNVIDLGDYQLQVAEACSGLRYLFPFLSLGFLAAYFFKAPLWQRALVFLSTVPITIFMNSFRIALTGVLVQKYGASHAEGMIHFFEGWVVFLLCMMMLFAVIAILSRLSGQKNIDGLLAMPEISPITGNKPWQVAIFTRNAIIISVALIAAGTYVHFGTSNVLRIPERTNLSQLNDDFHGWKSELLEVDKQTLEVLGADDFLITNLTSPDRQSFNLYIAYLNMQRHGHSWHSPRQCIPGGGWQIASHDILPTTSADGRKYYFNRIIIENRGSRQLLYYWYDQRGRKIANEFVMKIMLIFDAVRIRRTDGAMIRIMTPIDSSEPIEDADQRLQGFMRKLEPKLPAYIPPADAPAVLEFNPDA